MSKARTDAEAIATVKKALSAYADRVEPTAAAAEREMAKISEEIASFVQECQKNIRSLENALEVLRQEEEPNLSAIREKERQLAGWLRKHSDTRRLESSVARDHATFRGHQRRYTNAMKPLAEKGTARMRGAREDVIKYEKNQNVQARSATTTWRAMGTGGSSLGGGSSWGAVTSGDAGWSGAASTTSGPGAGSTTAHAGGDGSSSTAGAVAGTPAVHDPSTGRFADHGEVSVDGLPAGIVLVPLGRCVDEGRVRSSADFNSGKGTSDDLIWAVQSLYKDVIPRMGRGGDVLQRLHDTDNGRGNSGNRSLHATYVGFFGDQAIKVTELADGSYEVINGAHRIWAAQQLGVTHLPATVRRRNS